MEAVLVSVSATRLRANHLWLNQRLRLGRLHNTRLYTRYIVAWTCSMYEYIVIYYLRLDLWATQKVIIYVSYI